MADIAATDYNWYDPNGEIPTALEEELDELAKRDIEEMIHDLFAEDY